MLTIREAVSLARFSTFRIGGPARYLSEVGSTEEVVEAFQWAALNGVPTLFLGRGSNCLFDDRGFNGLVMVNRLIHCERRKIGYLVGSGYSFSRLGALASKENFSGLEFAASIPGTVGGAVFMNAGACGQQTADVLESVEFVSQEGEKISLGRQELEFGYRWSSFQNWEGAIVSATFSLEPSDRARDKCLQQMTQRRLKQPLDAPSAGCVFRNPPDQSAGKLIEQAGFKGVSVGGAQVSEKHANFIINRGSATSADVLELIDRVQEKIFEICGTRLECEVRHIAYE